MAPQPRAGKPPELARDDHDATAAPALALAEPAPSPHTQALLARRDIAALLAQVRSLTALQHAALAERFQANNRLHSLDQIRICHRISLAAPDSYPDHAAVRASVWRIAANVPGGQYAAAAAASDMSFVLLAGDLLAAHERSLFDSPWRTVVGDPEPTTAPVARPAPSMGDNRAWDHTAALDAEAALALLVADPIDAGALGAAVDRVATVGSRS